MVSSQASSFKWRPSPQQVAHTHIADLQKQLGLQDYSALHQWSIEHRDRFWDTMVKRLGIVLHQPYSKILDLSQGIEHPQWLVNAQLNIAESCFQAPADATAIIWQKPGHPLQTWTYERLEKLTHRVANGLGVMGVQPGDAVGIVLPMTAVAVAIYLGIVKAGGVVVSIAESFAAEEIRLRLQLAKAKVLFTQDTLDRCGKVLPLYPKIIKANAPKAVVLSRDSALPLRAIDLHWSDFLSANEAFQAVPCQPDDPTNILFSSGTTGEPKAIPWTHTTPIKCASDGHLHHDIHPSDRIAWPTSLGWMMGPWLIYAALINRAAIAIYDDAPTTRGFGEFIQQAGVTLLGVVPSLVSVWKHSHCMTGLDWSAIKAFSSTGECSNPEEMAFLMDLAGNKPVIEYCGGTEIGGGYITGTLVQPAIPATFTTPALGLDIVILDEAGHLSHQGEAFIVPPSMGLSTQLLNRDHHQVYFDGVPAFPLPLRRHGDQMERLAQGYYRALGRVDDTMNLSGIKVSAAEIERVLQQAPWIQDVAAVSVTSPKGGPSQLVVYVVVTPDTPCEKADLLADLRLRIQQQLNPLFKVHDLVIANTLPRTASNKIMRRTLLQNYFSLYAKSGI